MTLPNLLTSDVLDWLLEDTDPGVRYLALCDLLNRHPDDQELSAAWHEAHTKGPIAVILAEMEGEGYWVQPGPGYDPKYRGTVWSIIMNGAAYGTRKQTNKWVTLRALRVLKALA